MKKRFVTKGFFLVFLLGITISTFGQRGLIDIGDLSAVTITGSNNVNVNDTKTYTASAQGATIYQGSWSVQGATIVNQNNTSATIKWDQSGKKVIGYTAQTSRGTREGFYTVTVNAAIAPSTPTTPTVASQNCTNANLQRANPPSGITWYWQGTNSNGTSTSNSSTSYSVNTTGRYYLRARNTSGIWSTGSSSIYVTLGTIGGVTWYEDADNDNLGDPNSVKIQCTQPSGYVANNSDQCPTSHGGGTTNGCPATGGLSDENYVYTITPQKPVTDMSELTDNKDAIKNVTYFDGLGRAKQNVAIKQSNIEKDIVTHIEYDVFGRQEKEYLPYASTTNNGYFKTNAKNETNTYYWNNYQSDFSTSTNVNPYSEKLYEASPLNRVVKQGAPGKDWKASINGSYYDHGVEFKYDTNTANEVREYYVTTVYSNTNRIYTPTLQLTTTSARNNGYYKAGELSKTIVKDENHYGTTKNNTTEEFKNKEGQVVLKRTYASTSSATPEAHDTYYVYDKYGNLTYVLPPKAEAQSAKPDTVEISELSYQYKYDNRNRPVEKKVAGKGWKYIVYDNLNRPVLTQDANQKAKSPNQWLFTKYDLLGRVIYTGIYTSNSSRIALQTTFNSKIATANYETRTASLGFQAMYYSNNGFPNTNLEVLTVHYYDDYNIGNQVAFNPADGVGTWEGMIATTKTKGLPTVARVKVLDTDKWITTATYYDARGRAWESHVKNEYLKTNDWVLNKLDFVGKVLKTVSSHTKEDDNLPTISIVDNYTYDHVGRLTQQTQKIGNQAEEILAVNTYDALGQLKNKGIGGKTTQNRLQTVDYTYNVRGWLKQINNPASLGTDLFAFKINYNTANHSGTKLFNGNISETEWKTKNDNQLRWYKYSYDALNRIESAIDNQNRYSLSNVDYDKNGNITKLERRGHRVENPDTNTSSHFGLMDNLQYTSTSRSNKLTRVQELSDGHSTYGFKNGSNATTEYTYDMNGNMIRDDNKGITSIEYNHLNLPKRILFTTGGPLGKNEIKYNYDATGVKLRKEVINKEGFYSSTTTTEYAGNYIYTKLPNNPNPQYPVSSEFELQFFNHPEGYVQNNSGSFDYVYQYKDHLGNVRLSYADSNNDGIITASSDPNTNEIIEESSYYPFGLKHRGYNNVTSSNGNSTAQKSGFQEQEYTEDLGLNIHEWKYRVSDPAIGRFWQIDPLAEEYSWMTTYQFSSNQPIHAPELEGLESSADLTMDRWNRDYVKGKITKEELMANYKAQAVGGTVGVGLVVDVLFTKGKITKHLLQQIAIQTTFNGAEQLLSGEELDFSKALTDGAGSADLFDASFDTFLSKTLSSKATIASKVLGNIIPSMFDVTMDGGFQQGGVNKSFTDVAFDSSFSVFGDNLKGIDLPNTKISGNSFVKSIKNGIIDFGFNQTQQKIQNYDYKPNTRNRSFRPDPRLMQQQKDGTDIKLKHLKKI